jgi:hypothetical protein
VVRKRSKNRSRSTLKSLTTDKRTADQAKSIRGGSALPPGSGGLITQVGFSQGSASSKDPGSIDTSDINLVWKKP